MGEHVAGVQSDLGRQGAAGTEAGASVYGLRRRARRGAALVVLLFLLMGFGYSLVVPPFETPDELFHFGFAWHIAQGNGLPVQSEVETGPWAQEGSQAPLYYLLTGWMTSWIDQGDFGASAVRNPRANIGDPLDPGNKNFMLYSGRQPPLAGSNLALHIGRWFSLLLGAVTLWCVYLTAELGVVRMRRRREAHAVGSTDFGFALLAAAFVAAIPQFLFINASFTNDTLIIAACATGVYWLARLLAKPHAEPIRAYEWVVLGAIIGVAALSKLQGLGLIPLAGLVVLFLGWRRRSWRLLLEAAVLVGLPAAAIAGWWYVRNILLYGDWSGLGHLTAINGRRTEPLTLEDFWPEFRGLRYSFWGLFGWFNILLPEWFYRAADVLTVVAGAGVIGAGVQAVRQAWHEGPEELGTGRLVDATRLRLLVLLATWAVLMFVLLIYWTLQATGSQGRLIFPGIIAYGILLPLGIGFWLQWAPRLLRRAVWVGIFGVLIGMSLYALLWLLPAAYKAPAPVAQMPATAQAVNLRYAAAAPVELVGIEVGKGRYHPGERVPLTLYWRAEEALPEDYQLFIQFLDETGREVANLTSHPGWGRNPTSFWEAGALYADPYAVLVKGPIDARSPLLARVYTGLIDPQSAEAENLPLPARTAAGDEVTPFVAQVEVAAWAQPSFTLVGEETGASAAGAGEAQTDGAPAREEGAVELHAAGAVFGDVIRLAGLAAPQEVVLGAPENSAGNVLTVTLGWEALGQPATDYTAYVHVLDQTGQQVAGFDQAPAADRFPTSRWRSGDRIVSTFPAPLPAELPPGEYTLWVGLYETASAGARRLPVTDAGSLPSGDGQVQAAGFRVRR
jgi:hypothetical protein